jgi:hypothetical protein
VVGRQHHVAAALEHLKLGRHRPRRSAQVRGGDDVGHDIRGRGDVDRLWAEWPGSPTDAEVQWAGAAHQSHVTERGPLPSSVTVPIITPACQLAAVLAGDRKLDVAIVDVVVVDVVVVVDAVVAACAGVDVVVSVPCRASRPGDESCPWPRWIAPERQARLRRAHPSGAR